LSSGFTRPTRQKIGHFGAVLPSQSLGLIQKNYIKHNKSKHASTAKYTTAGNEHRKLKPGYVASYDLQARKQKGPILKVDK